MSHDITINGVVCTWVPCDEEWITPVSLYCMFCDSIKSKDLCVWAYKDTRFSIKSLEIYLASPILTAVDETTYIAHCHNPICRKKIEVELACPTI